MPDDLLNLTLPVIGPVSIGATAQDGAVRVIVTTGLGNQRALLEPEAIRRFCRVLEHAATAAEAQQVATSTGQA